MFEKRVRELRKQNGLSQAELAKKLDVSPGTITMWETGNRKPSMDLLIALSEVFDRRIDYILGVSDDDSSRELKEEEIPQWGERTRIYEFDDVFKAYATLDTFGKQAVNNLIESEVNRCKEQRTLLNADYIDFETYIR